MIRTITASAAVVALALTAACAAPTVNTGSVSPGSGSAQPAAAPAAEPARKPPTWFERYTWPSGVAVEVAKPEVCKPSKTAFPQNTARAVKVTVTIINGSQQPLDSTLLALAKATLNGQNAEAVSDTSGPCGAGMQTPGTVLPGKSAKFSQAYVAPAAGELQLELQPDFGSDKAIYVGQA